MTSEAVMLKVALLLAIAFTVVAASGLSLWILFISIGPNHETDSINSLLVGLPSAFIGAVIWLFYGVSRIRSSRSLAAGPMALVISAIVVIATLVGFLYLSSSPPQTFPISTITVTHSATSFSVARYGPRVSLQEARTLAGVNFHLPQYLPNNLSLVQIRAERDLAAAVYSSPTLPAIPDYVNASMILVVQHDSTTYYFPGSPMVVITDVHSCSTPAGGAVTCTDMISTTTQSQTDTPVQVVVSGHPGWGITYQGTGFTFLNWWSNGIHYDLEADLPISALVSTADSMNT